MAQPPIPIRARPRPGCPVCGAGGQVLYRDLVDAVWGTPGLWTMDHCSDRTCGTLWLDPAPLEEDMPRAYERYQTHTPAAPDRPGNGPGWLEGAKRGHLSRAFGYDGLGGGPAERAWAGVLKVLPQQRARLEASIGYLRGDPPGRLLDVGAGAGGFMARMRALGWEVEGVDSDPAAVAAARARGLEVARGTLQALGYPGARFDAVTLNHVVEHLHDPGGTLDECFRVLKPDGLLVLETPNAGARLHAWCGRDWRGLEPPRHLQIFTLPGLTRLVRDRGFEILRGFTSPKSSSFFFAASWAGRRARTRGIWSCDRLDRGLRIAGGLAAALEVGLAALQPTRGEELVVVARRVRTAS